MSLKGNKILLKLKAKIKNIAPIHIGNSDNELLIEKNTNNVYIPGTSVAGAMRAYVSNKYGVEIEEKYFGKQQSSSGDSLQSSIYFLDLFSPLHGIEVRDGIRINEMGVASNKGKFEREYISKGHEFELSIKMFLKDEKDVVEAKEILFSMLNALQNKKIKLGAYKTVGGGAFEIQDAKISQIDFQNKEEIFEYLLRKENYRNVTEEIINKQFIDNEYATFKIKCKASNGMLIGGKSENSKAKCDISPLNINGEYIIPGSTLKGVIRNRCERILGCFEKENLIEDIFGTADVTLKKQSRVYVEESILTNTFTTKYNKTRIDKFTGGVVEGALMDFEVVKGEFYITFNYKISKEKEELNEIAIAVLALTARDILTENVTIGSRSSIGMGRVTGESLEINFNNKRVYVNVASNVSEGTEFIDEKIEWLTL